MYYVLKVGSEYLGIVDGRAALVARQCRALRFDAPFSPHTSGTTFNSFGPVRFVKIVPRDRTPVYIPGLGWSIGQPENMMPDDADIRADIDASTRESDAEYLNPPF